MTIPEWLGALEDTERMLLINKYTQQTENIYYTFCAKERIDIITKIFSFKFNKDALVDSYVNGDPVVDHPGCRLDEFLRDEILKQIMHR
jgi:MinD superfamily P-loop ATPase